MQTETTTTNALANKFMETGKKLRSGELSFPQKPIILEARRVDQDGLIRYHGEFYQVPIEFAGQIIRVDMENREFDPHPTSLDRNAARPALNYPSLKRGRLNIQE